MRQRGELLAGILNLVKEGVSNVIDLQRAIISAGYGASMGKIDWEYAKIHSKRDDSKSKERFAKEKQRKLSKYFWKLKNDGLIEEFKNGSLHITKKGEKSLSTFYQNNYKKEKSENLLIVSFDIPEKFRRERNILRGSLKFLDFEMVHQSTWYGKNKIPAELLKKLSNAGILEYIKIFEVSKKGTLVEKTQ